MNHDRVLEASDRGGSSFWGGGVDGREEMILADEVADFDVED